MPTIIKPSELKFEKRKSPIEEFVWNTCVPRLSDQVKSKYLVFDIRSLDPGKYSFPYHFHRLAEEMFVVFSGEMTLRTEEGFEKVVAGDIVFVETGKESAHQLFNHADVPCVYLDIRTFQGVDIVEYPDSGKINILPEYEVFESSSKVDYFQGEENVASIWKKLQNS